MSIGAGRCSKANNLQGQGKTSSNKRHDNIDFKPIVTTKISKIRKISVVIAAADKGYDSEDNHVLVRENHVLVREKLNGFSVIPTRYKNVPIWKTLGRYRKKR